MLVQSNPGQKFGLKNFKNEMKIWSGTYIYMYLIYICKTPKSDGHAKVRWSALKSYGLPCQSLMLSEYVCY